MDSLVEIPEVNEAGIDGGVRAKCCHYWVIETPNGSNSRGICKFCKEERLFNNSVDRYFIKKRGERRVTALKPVAAE